MIIDPIIAVRGGRRLTGIVNNFVPAFTLPSSISDVFSGLKVFVS